MRYVTIKKFSSESGYTEAAVRSKIGEGIWREGCVWLHAPDGRVLIDVQGFEAWVEAGCARKRSVNGRAKLAVRQKTSSLSLSPPPLVR